MRHVSGVVGMILAGVFYCWSPPTTAQEVRPDELIKNRVANFREIGTAFKAIRDELKSNDPNMHSIRESASQIESLGSQLMTWFPLGGAPPPEPQKGFLEAILDWFSSEPVAAVEESKTKAKPAIWSQRVSFEATYRAFDAEAGKMSRAAQRGNRSEVAAQFKALGETCKKCHEAFREKTDEE